MDGEDDSSDWEIGVLVGFVALETVGVAVGLDIRPDGLIGCEDLVRCVLDPLARILSLLLPTVPFSPLTIFSLKCEGGSPIPI